MDNTALINQLESLLDSIKDKTFQNDCTEANEVINRLKTDLKTIISKESGRNFQDMFSNVKNLQLPDEEKDQRLLEITEKRIKSLSNTQSFIKIKKEQEQSYPLLNPKTIEFYSFGLYLKENMPQGVDDFSPALFSMCRAVENEMKKQWFEKLTRKPDNTDIQNKRLKKYLLSKEDLLTFVQMERILSEERYEELKVVAKIYYENKVELNENLSKIGVFRNGAGHTEIYRQEDTEYVNEKVKSVFELIGKSL